MKDIHHILFVCTGNSCRSVMAEAYLRKRLAEENFTQIEVKSAGTLGLEGLDPTQETVDVLHEEGIELGGRTSKTITKDLIEWADAIFVMEDMHKIRLLAATPGIETKIHYLGDFNESDKIKQIVDPIGRPLEFYKKTFDSIKKSIEGLIKWLKL